MKSKITILGLSSCCLLATLAFTQNNEVEQDPLALSPIVAKQTTTPNGTLISCNLKMLKDTIDLPLSYLTENLEVVKLDGRDEALVGGGTRTKISNNYILVSNRKQTPYKLFTRSGKYIASIGAYGQGPNEYGNTYAEQLDEANNRIYILPWQSDKLLVFDLKGKPQPPIPLCMRVPKGQFRVDTKKMEVTVTTLPFKGGPAVVWTQDLKGKRKSYVPSGHLTLPQDFSNEVLMGNNTSDYTVMLLTIMPSPRIDSLYHYNVVKNRLEARFTAEYPNKEKIPWHGYSEYPRHFIGDVSWPIQVSEHTWSSSKPANYIVDKKTLHGNYFRLYNDFLGTKKMEIWPSFENGYYVTNMEPSQLKENLKKELARKDIPAEVRKRTQDLVKSLDEEGNNVILLAKMKR
ncbi:6-bladed beta-propeller [Bacteroides sp.]|uniref:6-bladed beta-propeller n=1 Tax=Bacteroides sp. TaxID=29523 RepID=UPI0026203916|nr:6-bladed beta-propeller [Bacteroides sp.]MDD3036891.1 6-bladed beta-propeller [Bacteroides sp.]